MSGPSAKPSADSAQQRVDLSRLQIQRRPGDRTRVGGLPWIRILLVLALAGVLFLFRDRILGAVDEVRGTTVRTVRAQKVGPGAGDEGEVSANGYVVADRIASLATVLSGLLVELNVQEGDRVAEKQVVGRIQYDDLAAELARAKKAQAAAEARVASARADRRAAARDIPRLEKAVQIQQEVLAQARATKARLDREVERNRRLREQDRIDEGTWDRVQTEASVAALAVLAAERRLEEREAALAQWREQLESLAARIEVAAADAATAKEAVAFAGIQLEKTKIVAPFAGIVIRKDAEEGEVIAPTGAGNSRGSVVTIVDPGSFEIQVELSERRLLKVREGDRATVVLDADPDTGYGATVRKIWPRAERSKGTIELRVRLDEQPAILRPDMAARVTFAGRTKDDLPAEAKKAYVTVPRGVLRTRGDASHVFVLRGDRVARRAVTLGEAQGEIVVIESGLEGGETLVLDPPADLRDGDVVRVDTGN